MRRMNEGERRLQRAGDWAHAQPMNRWNPLPLMASPHMETIYAVKTATGRILTGTAKAFSGNSLNMIHRDPRYGAATGFLQVEPRVLA